MLSCRFAPVVIAGFAAASACELRRPATAPSAVSFERLRIMGLELREAGAAVVRDTAAWRALWRYDLRGRTEPPDAETPDFGRAALIVVSFGTVVGCPNPDDPDEPFINRVVRVGDTLVVLIGPTRRPDPGAPARFGCMAETAPVAFARVGRVDAAGPVVFRASLPELPMPTAAPRWGPHAGRLP